MKKKLLGVSVHLPYQLKKEYQPKGYKSPKNDLRFTMMEVFQIKKHEVICYLNHTDSAGRWLAEACSLKKLTKKEEEKEKRRMKRIEKNKDKPVDTSNWVKPDKESIKNTLIKSLFDLIVLDPESTPRSFWEAKGVANTCYGILHSKNPNNPQSLDSYCLERYYEKILFEIKHKDRFKHKKIIWPDYPKCKKYNKNARKDVQKWKKKILKKLIKIKYYKPKKAVGYYKKEQEVCK